MYCHKLRKHFLYRKYNFFLLVIFSQGLYSRMANMVEWRGCINDDIGHGNDSWPLCENVLLSLTEDVRPKGAADRDESDTDAAVSVNVQSCLAERVGPSEGTAERRHLRQIHQRWRPSPVVTPVISAARRTHARLMGVRSAYLDGKYYGSDVPHVSRTVEELSTWTAVTVLNEYTFTAGTVLYDHGDTGACHLHGLVDAQSRVAVDCSLLTTALPRHRSTIKLYSKLRTAPDGRAATPPVLVSHHFHVFTTMIR